MRVALCNFDHEPWRIDLAAKLAAEFARRGHECFYYGYKKDIESEFVDRDTPLKYVRFPKYNSKKTALVEHKSWTPEELEEIATYNSRLNLVLRRPATENAQLFKKIRVFLQKLRGLQDDLCVDMFIVWGGIRFHERAIVAFAKHYGRSFHYIELGYFRPFTLTVEQVGLNDDNSLPRDEKFYQALYPNVSIDPEEIVRPRATRPNASVQQPSVPRSDRLDLSEHSPYVFVPFQVETDSQIIEYSPHIKSMRNLVALTCEAVIDYNARYNANLRVVFKPHPVDKKIALKPIEQRMSVYGHASIEHNADTAELINGAALVITINSTVGLEAIMRFKPVVTLGRAFYNLPRLVTNCLDYDDLPDAMHRAMTREPDREFSLKYLKYLREEYFHEIYYEDADRKSVVALVDRLLTTA